MLAINFSDTRMKRLWISLNVFYIYVFVLSGNNQLAYNALLSQTEMTFLFFHSSYFLCYIFFRTRDHFFAPKVTVIDLKITVNTFSNKSDGDFVCFFKDTAQLFYTS